MVQISTTYRYELHGVQSESHRIRFDSLRKDIREGYERVCEEKGCFRLRDLDALCEQFEVPLGLMNQWLPTITQDCLIPFTGQELRLLWLYCTNQYNPKQSRPVS